MLALTAAETEPLSRTTSSPLLISTATNDKGIARSRKSAFFNPLSSILIILLPLMKPRRGIV